MTNYEDILNAQRRAQKHIARVQEAIQKDNEEIREKVEMLSQDQTDHDTLRMRYARKLNAKPRNRAGLELAFETALDTAELRENYTVNAYFAPFVHVTNKFSGAEDILVFQDIPRFYWQFEKDPEAIELLTGVKFPVSEDFVFTDWLEK